METKQQFPRTAQFPFHFKKTFTPASAPIRRGETPEIEFSKTLRVHAIFPGHVPEPLGYSAWTFRSSVVFGQTLNALSAFADLSYEDALELHVSTAELRDHADALIRGCNLVCNLHEKGIIHGDLHLDNIMRDEDERIVLIDLAANDVDSRSHITAQQARTVQLVKRDVARATWDEFCSNLAGLNDEFPILNGTGVLDFGLGPLPDAELRRFFIRAIEVSSDDSARRRLAVGLCLVTSANPSTLEAIAEHLTVPFSDGSVNTLANLMRRRSGSDLSDEWHAVFKALTEWLWDDPDHHGWTAIFDGQLRFHLKKLSERVVSSPEFKSVVLSSPDFTAAPSWLTAGTDKIIQSTGEFGTRPPILLKATDFDESRKRQIAASILQYFYWYPHGFTAGELKALDEICGATPPTLRGNWAVGLTSRSTELVRDLLHSQGTANVDSLGAANNLLLQHPERKWLRVRELPPTLQAIPSIAGASLQTSELVAQVTVRGHPLPAPLDQVNAEVKADLLFKRMLQLSNGTVMWSREPLHVRLFQFRIPQTDQSSGFAGRNLALGVDA